MGQLLAERSQQLYLLAFKKFQSGNLPMSLFLLLPWVKPLAVGETSLIPKPLETQLIYLGNFIFLAIYVQ